MSNAGTSGGGYLSAGAVIDDTYTVLSFLGAGAAGRRSSGMGLQPVPDGTDNPGHVRRRGIGCPGPCVKRGIP